MDRKNIIYDLKNGFDISKITDNELPENDKKMPLKNQSRKSLLYNDFSEQYVSLKMRSKKCLMRINNGK